MTELLITRLAAEVGRLAQARGIVISVAESCTGGGLAEAITRVAGSSAWFDRALVTYSNQAKQELLGVSAATLDRHGAVSEAVAGEMAAGVLSRTSSHVSVSITGIAGPGGATPGKPVGMVWIAWAARGEEVQPRRFQFEGDRQAVRRQSVATALQGLVQLLT